MTEQDGEAKGELQFDKADFGEDAPVDITCAQCTAPIGSAYFEAAGKVTCEPCRYRLEEFLQSKAGLAGGLKALSAGIAAGIVGWIIYYAVLALSGYQFGLIAVVVGFLVGRAVRWGSGNRGGAGFQAMAIAITYVTIVSTYVPIVVREIREQATREAVQQVQSTASGQPSGAPPIQAPGAAPAATPPAPAGNAVPPAPVELTGGQVAAALAAFGLVILALPFLQGFGNIIGIAIIAFALYEAWRVNRRVKIQINGPFVPGRAPAV